MDVAKIEAVLGAATKTKMSMNSSEKDRRPPEKTSIFGEIILFLKARPFSMQGIYQLSKSGEARFQIMLKVGGQNQKSMASISDFGQNLAKVGGNSPPCPPVDKCPAMKF